MNVVRTLSCLLLLCPLGFCPTALAAVGSVDASFDAPVPNNWVRAVALQPDGKIIIGGDFTLVGGTNRIRIARLFANGQVDASFNSGTGPNAYVAGVAVQSDGRVLITGSFTSVNGTPRNKYARLNTDGTLDASFAATQPVIGSGDGRQIQALANGKVLLVGPTVIFTFSPLVSRNVFMVLNTNGTCDTTFTNLPVAGAIYNGAVTAAGKFLMGGTFSTTDGSNRTNLVQLDSTGALDTGFIQPPVANIGLIQPHVMPDGRIVVHSTGSGMNHVRRLNSNGTADGSFTPVTANAGILTATVQPDGKIWIAGDFDTINGSQLRLKIARLNADGTLDASYDPGQGTGTSVFALTLQPDARLLVGGAFNCYNNVCQGPIIRLLGDLTAGNPKLIGTTFNVVVATAVGKNYTLQYKNSLSETNWTSLPSVAGDGTEKPLTDSGATAPRRVYRVVEN